MGGRCSSWCRSCFDLPPPINKAKVDLSHFLLHRVLGKGGFGKVQVVESRLNGELYALKRMSKRWLLGSASNVRSVWLERHIMVQLRSNFLVPCYYAFQDPNYIYLVMRFQPGGDLHYLLFLDHIKAITARGRSVGAKPLTEKFAQHYGAEILLGLEALHRAGLVYRDLKPSNCLLDSEGHAALSDFGLAGDLNAEEDGMTMGSCGTPGYMSQELLAQCRYDTTPDVYAFGVLLYELLHGRVPTQYEDPVEIKMNPHISAECADLLRALLHHDVANRLGCDVSLPPAERWAAVKTHPFFSGIDWDVASVRGLTPPFRPEADTANCDPSHEVEEQMAMLEMDEQSPGDPLTEEEDAIWHGWDFRTEPECHSKHQSNLLPLSAAGPASSSFSSTTDSPPEREDNELVRGGLGGGRHVRNGTSGEFDDLEMAVLPAAGHAHAHARTVLGPGQPAATPEAAAFASMAASLVLQADGSAAPSGSSSARKPSAAKPDDKSSKRTCSDFTFNKPFVPPPRSVVPAITQSTPLSPRHARSSSAVLEVDSLSSIAIEMPAGLLVPSSRPAQPSAGIAETSAEVSDEEDARDL